MHVYQRAVNGVNVFYDLEDYLVFYTIFSVIVRQYEVAVLELCIMIDHVHILFSSVSLDAIWKFIRHYTSVFVREYNDGVGRKGTLFHKSFGSAPKKGSKAIRSAIIYIGNNPVEKGLSVDAAGYMWNFLSYIPRFCDKHVFSHGIPARHMRGKLRQALSEVSASKDASLYLGYGRLRRLLKGLDENERRVLVDHIVMTYWPFDEDMLLSYFDDYESMLVAMKSTSGSEYDIKERFYSGSDVCYREMMDLLKSEQVGDVYGLDSQMRRVTVLPAEEKAYVAELLQRYTSASPGRIRKFLHF